MEIVSGPLKNARGRHENMIIYQVGDKTYARQVPSYDGNKDSETRTIQNTRMSSVVTLYQSIKGTFAEIAWRIEARRLLLKSGYNYFVKTNLNAYSNNYTVGDFALLFMTVGQLQIPFNLRRQESPVGTLALTWEVSPWMGKRREKDRLGIAVIYDNEPFRVEFIESTGITRQEGEATLQFGRPGASAAHVYCFFMNETQSEFTNSMYFNVSMEQI